jgi:hypothetical protein
MSAYSDSVFEPAFSELTPVSAKKYRNGSRNRVFPFIFIASGYDGFGLSYRCGKCDFDLHEHCMMYPPTTSVPFHAQHAVEFEAEAAMFPENPHNCNICSAL